MLPTFRLPFVFGVLFLLVFPAIVFITIDLITISTYSHSLSSPPPSLSLIVFSLTNTTFYYTVLSLLLDTVQLFWSFIEVLTGSTINLINSTVTPVGVTVPVGVSGFPSKPLQPQEYDFHSVLIFLGLFLLSSHRVNIN